LQGSRVFGQGLLDLPGDRLHSPSIGVDHQVGYFAVQRVPLRHQPFQDLCLVATSEERSLAAAIRAFKLLPHAGVEIDHVAARSQVFAAVRVEHGSAAGSQDNAFELRQVVDDAGFAGTETFFTLFLEDERDVDAGPRFYFVVAVDKVEMQHAGQLPADGGFAGAHGAYQEQVVRVFHFTVQ